MNWPAAGDATRRRDARIEPGCVCHRPVSVDDHQAATAAFGCAARGSEPSQYAGGIPHKIIRVKFVCPRPAGVVFGHHPTIPQPKVQPHDIEKAIRISSNVVGVHDLLFELEQAARRAEEES
eukprot:3528946-Prymnesium_polylepis.1